MTRAVERALAVPEGFSFGATVHSHGWCALAPWRWDGRALARPLPVPGGVTMIELTQSQGRGTAVRARVAGGVGSRSGLDGSGWQAVAGSVRRCLRLDASLEPFHARCRQAGSPFDEAPAMGFGRLLRSPTVFEDLVKVLATTNTTWSGTVSMVGRLVEIAGVGGGFPTPRRVVEVGAGRLREEGRWGYRAAYLEALARAAAEGTVDLEGWATSEAPTEDLAAEIRSLPGFGPYATAHVLALIGRYDRIGVDTVFRDFVHRRHFPAAAEPPADRRMVEVYEPWGEWKALAYWFEMWREAVEDEVWGLEEPL